MRDSTKRTRHPPDPRYCMVAPRRELSRMESALNEMRLALSCSDARNMQVKRNPLKALVRCLTPVRLERSSSRFREPQPISKSVFCAHLPSRKIFLATLRCFSVQCSFTCVGPSFLFVADSILFAERALPEKRVQQRGQGRMEVRSGCGENY